MTIQTESKNKFRAAVAAAALAVSLVIVASVVITAVPAAAATSACDVWGTKPFTDNTYVYGDGVINCGAVSGTLAVKVRASMQEKVGFVWTVRTNSYAYSSGTNLNLLKATSYYCNGHGTDLYKTRGTGWDNQEETRTEYSAQKSLTC